LAEDRFVGGPEWFIWVLLFFGIALAVILIPFERWMPSAERFMAKLQDHPLSTFVTIFFLAALVYLPLLARYGFGAWTDFLTSPFSFQICRIGLYALLFTLGFLVGVPGIDRGLLSLDGALARHWRLWILGCVIAYNALVFVPRIYPRPKLEAVLWVLSCVASCFGFLALFRGIQLTSRSWMNSLSRSAYVMYLVHYVFLTWMQRLMLDQPVHASIKFLFVFLSTTLLSWLTAQAFLRIPKLNTIL
jgi:glucan biosynthesis protein C